MSPVQRSQPGSAEDLDRLLAVMKAAKRRPDNVMHVWDHDITAVERAISRIEALEGALQFLMDTSWKSVDRDNMEFEGRVTCYQLDRARATLQRTDR